MKTQEDIKQQADKGRKEAEEWKKGDKVMLNIKDLVFKERLAKKLVNWYVGSYIIDKVVSTNAVKFRTANFNENSPSCECQSDRAV